MSKPKLLYYGGRKELVRTISPDALAHGLLQSTADSVYFNADRCRCERLPQGLGDVRYPATLLHTNAEIFENSDPAEGERREKDTTRQ